MNSNRIRTYLRNALFCFAFGLAFVLLVEPAQAVEPGKTSYTAEAVCAFRAIGSQDPDPKTRNPDHLAKRFMNPAWNQRFPGLGLDYKDAKLAMDQMNTGVYYYVNARTLHMDAMLTTALKAGARQVVIMGAGFDSRAYRFHESYPEVRFFEIDLPATSADKQQRVQKILGRKPDWVTFVPIDFNTQSLGEVLGKAGFAKDQKTFFVWEGVTYFISKAGVNNTLQFIAENSAPGSRIVFDYMLEDVVQGMDYSPYGARRTVYAVAFRGEPYVFGIVPRNLESFVHLRGLALLSDLGPEDLTQRHLIRSDGTTSGKIAEFLRIVHVEVPRAAQQERFRRQAAKQLKSMDAESRPASMAHAVKVPDDIQALLDASTKSIKGSDYPALIDCFSPDYLSYGRSREQAVSGIKRIYGDRPLDLYKIILTRCDLNGDKAEIDGFVQRNGFRTPLMVHRIVKEGDGRWRWYGNQQ